MKAHFYLWQVDEEKNPEMPFLNYRDMREFGFNVYPSEYKMVYEGEIKGESIPKILESLFAIFNISRPNDFKGWSMSVSDVVMLVIDNEYRSWFCDSFGFKEVPEFYDHYYDDEAPGPEDYEVAFRSRYTEKEYGPGNPWDAPGMSVKDFI